MNSTDNFEKNILHYSHNLSLISTFIFNGLLCFCLYVERRKEIRIYSIVLYIQCCSDMAASVTYYFAAVRFVMIDGTFFVVSTGPWFESGIVNTFGNEIPSRYLALFLYPISTGLAIVFVPLNFYYRYRRVVK